MNLPDVVTAGQGRQDARAQAMRYGQTRNGQRWHMLRETHTMCGIKRATVAVETDETPYEGICENCDAAL